MRRRATVCVGATGCRYNFMGFGNRAQTLPLKGRKKKIVGPRSMSKTGHAASRASVYQLGVAGMGKWAPALERHQGHLSRRCPHSRS
jgi:hypothetical protein